MSKKLKIKLHPDGRVEMVTEGIKGKKCLDYIPFLEKIADVKVEKYELTDEYYEVKTDICEEETESVQNNL